MNTTMTLNVNMNVRGEYMGYEFTGRIANTYTPLDGAVSGLYIVLDAALWVYGGGEDDTPIHGLYLDIDETGKDIRANGGWVEAVMEEPVTYKVGDEVGGRWNHQDFEGVIINVLPALDDSGDSLIVVQLATPVMAGLWETDLISLEIDRNGVDVEGVGNLLPLVDARAADRERNLPATR